MDLPLTLIANEHSGKRSRELLDALRASLVETLGAPVAFHPIRRGRDLKEAIAAIRAKRQGTVFVAGGDGTISAVADAIKDIEVTLAPLPMGTFNYFARGLAIPETADEAVKALASGVTVRVPVGEVNGRLFLNNASIGLYPAILAEREGIYRRWGRSRLAAYWSVIKTVLRSSHRLHLPVSVDGHRRELRTSMIFVGANPYQLERFQLEGAEVVRDGRLAAFVGGDYGRLGLLAAAVRLALGLTRRDETFSPLDGAEFVIGTSRRRLTVAMDGERFRFRGPLVIRRWPGGLKVLAPAAATLDQAA
jgi:diacylglycerol kinase family enzyme